jgi:hypothetical protein
MLSLRRAAIGAAGCNIKGSCMIYSFAFSVIIILSMFKKSGISLLLIFL